MKREELLLSLGEISDGFIEETAARLEGQLSFSRPGRRVRRAIISAAAVLVLLFGTFATAMAVNVDFREAVAAFFHYTERAGQTRVLTKDTLLTDCYSYAYSEGDDYSTYEWIPVDGTYPLQAGDILVVLEEADGMSRVVIPYGDVPFLYGHVSSDLLSKDPAKLEKGNQARITDCDCYDAPGGTVIDRSSARVEIQAYDGDWAYVQEFGTGNEPYWVRSGDLSFDFDEVLLDLPE